jgi:phospholipid/cholesterol/gamma-HCH transport system substrate-binding protein
METKRLEMKVGLFVFLGLALLGVLMLQFSKGLTLFRGTYELRLHASNVGGLKKRSSVLMSGVQVGTVNDIKLAPNGKSVTIFLKVFSDYVIHKDARFLIEQSGFLGDQYVAIVPTENVGEVLGNNAEVDCEEPFNLQEVARSAGGLIRRVDDTAKMLNNAVVDVRKLLLNEQTLTNLSATVTTMRSASERALTTMDNLNRIFETNGPVLSHAANTLDLSSEEVRQFAQGLNHMLSTNGESISLAVKNLETSSEVLKHILEDANAGKGAVGTLLHNESVATNMTAIVNNLSITTSNLNRLGLWGILWSKKPPKTNSPAATKSGR